MITISFRALVFVACGLLWFPATRAAEPPAPAAVEVAVSAVEPAASSQLVALDLWVVTLRMPKDVAQEDQFGPLLARVENLPTVIGGRDAARKLLDRLKDQGAVRQLQTFRMSTLSGHKGYMLRGERTPTIIGMSQSDFGQTNSIQYLQTGTIVQWTPTVVNAQEIQVDISYERSDVVNSGDVAIAQPKDGEPTPAQSVPSLTITTAATLKSGEAAIVSLASDTEQENSTLLILSTAMVGQEALE